MEIRVHSAIDDIDRGAWNALLSDGQPFLHHEFLGALERHGCATPETGWQPCHLALYRGDRLAGALPLYEKRNSWGEFVFDQAWAEAYARSGLRYYPKLVSAVPFTPLTGKRFLAAKGERREVMPRLLESALALARERGASGFHCLFPEKEERDWLEGEGLMVRSDCQFHWHNRGYRAFEDFLGALSAKKRKNVRRERKRVKESGVTIRLLDGRRATGGEWRLFDRLYRSIYDRKWGFPALNRSFFAEVARKLPEETLLVLAERGGRTIAGALMYRDEKALYGRYWGALEQVDNLHFEVCYYRGIEYCIENGLERFEPGAQGEHKLARGFLPTRTHSCHWIAPGSPHRRAIANFIAQERSAVDEYCDDAARHSPYRSGFEYQVSD